MSSDAAGPRLYALLAEYRSTDGVLEAAKKATAQGYKQVEAYSPFPVHGLAEALDHQHTNLPRLVFVGGLVGCIVGFLMQYVLTVHVYPLNIGGRPLNSWPAFVPVTFELTILFAALTTVLGMLALNGLPRPHHPVFSVERFDLSAGDRFYLIISVDDPLFDRAGTETFLESTGPRGVYEVPAP